MKTLIKKRDVLLRKIEHCSDFLRGSIASVCSTCNRVNCICNGKATGPAFRLTYKNADQKTRTVYIPKAQLPKAKKMLSNYKEMRKLTEQLLEMNIAIFKEQSKTE